MAKGNGRSVAVRARRAAADDVCCALGEVVAFHREAAGFSQDDLAAVVGVSQHVVSCWETGRANIAAQQLLFVAARLCVPPGALLADGWADASPCARMLVPRPAGDEPAELRFRRPPRRPPRPAPPEDPADPADLVERFVAAGLEPRTAGYAADLLIDGDRCEVGWQRGTCGLRPVKAGVRVNRTRRWEDISSARIVARVLCARHAGRLDGGWVIVDLPAATPPARPSRP